MIADTQTESEFEYAPLSDLYVQALRDVGDRQLDERERKAAARALAFLLREQLVTERVATDVLTVLHRSLDVSKVVRTLLLGLVGVSPPEKIVAWTRTVADHALREGNLSSFVSAMRILVDLGGYDGDVPTLWRLSVLRAAEVPELTSRVLLFTTAYARRFSSESWLWVRKARAACMITSLRHRVTVAELQEARDP